MVKKYIVTLTAEERAELEQLTKTGRRAADQITRARILLKADSNQPSGSWIDEEIAVALDVSTTTVERTRRRCVEMGVQASLKRQPGGGRKERCLNGEQEAHLVALVCSEAPAGLSHKAMINYYLTWIIKRNFCNSFTFRGKVK